MTPREALNATRIRWRGAHISKRERKILNGLDENLEKPSTCPFCILAGFGADGAPMCGNCVLTEVFPTVLMAARAGANAACESLFYRVKAVPQSVELEAKYIFRLIEEHLDRTAQVEMLTGEK